MTRIPPNRLTGSLSVLAVAVSLAGPAPAQNANFTGPEDFSALAEARLPAVVGIVATAPTPQEGQPGLPMPMLPPGLEDFFGGPLPQPQPRGPRQALGSGFIISADGYVVTNNHVIAGADAIEVMLDGDRSMNAEIVGTDPATDIALLKIDGADDLPFVEWGSSDDLEIGEWVVAIGNPFGLGGTVTAGIVSAQARDIRSGPYDDFIQTDAAINSGNSGGPLFDATGEVVGVNTAIFSPTGGNVGIGFAVPAHVVSRVVDDLREDGQVDRGWLGVQIQPVSDELAAALGLEEARGALVNDVVPDSPAEAAGFENGDVILAIAGEDVETPRELVFAVADRPIGEAVDLTVWRDGERETLSVEIARQPGATMAAAPGGEGGGEEGQDEATRLGVTLAPLSQELRAQFELPPEVSGLAILAVEPESRAADAGLVSGDVIVEAGGQPVGDAADITDALTAAEAEGQPMLLRVFRGGSHQFLAVPLSENEG